MISSGKVNEDLTSVTSIFSKYKSLTEEMSGSWKGLSFDSYQRQSSEFSSSYLSTIESQMNAFASACDLYVEYENTKKSLNVAKENYSIAVSNDDKAKQRSYNSAISEYTNKLESLKSQIESLLSTASGGTLDAVNASITVSSSSNSGDDISHKKSEVDVTSDSPSKKWSDDENFTYYNQKGNWGNYAYSSGGSNTMGNSGCGPTSMAMVMSSLGYDVNPSTAANWSAKNGYHSKDGTVHGFFTEYANSMGVSNKTLSVSSANIKNSLSNGDLLILSMNPGDFTSSGHFIVARGYDAESNKVLIADPNQESNNTWWDLDRVTNQTKGCWAYSSAEV